MNGPRIALLMLSLVPGLCLAGGEPSPTKPVTPAPRAPELAPAVTQPAGEPVTIASVPREVRRAVAAAAAKQFGVAVNDVVVTRAEQVTWSDGSLGCPEPGRMYTQMLVQGYRVTARSGDLESVFHTDARGLSVACGRVAAPRPRGVEPGTAPAPRPAPDR
jgi:hypothetical protein